MEFGSDYGAPIGQTNVGDEVEAQNPVTEQTVSTSSKKRKEIDSKSLVWKYFERVKDNEGVTQKGRCLYCDKLFNSHHKRHGTSSLRNHILTCAKNPHSKDNRQSLLTLKPAGVESSTSETIGVLETWKFDQDVFRKALVEMVIINELPLKFVKREGFKKFIYVCYPIFKISSRWIVNRDCISMYLEERLKLKNFFKQHCERVSLTIDF